jgi:Tfp pilus assembly protein PilO
MLRNAYIIDNETRRFGRLLHYTGVLAAVLCATTGYSLVHAPTAHAIANTALRIEEMALSVQNAPLIRDQHRKISQSLREVESRIAAIQRRVPRDADGGAFLKEVTQIADAEQLAIKDFQPQKANAKTGYAEMQVMVKGRGSYASICSFIARLNQLNRLSKVQDLTLSASDDASEYPMTATLIIYFGLRGADAKPAQEDRRG